MSFAPWPKQKPRPSHVAHPSAARSEREARLEAQLTAAVRARYPEGPLRPLTGGAFFRELADELGVDELKLSAVARRLGYWPWQPVDILRAQAAARDGHEFVTARGVCYPIGWVSE